MKKNRNLAHIAERLYNTPLLLLTAKHAVLCNVFAQALTTTMAWDDEEGTPDPPKTHVMAGDVAVFPVHGTLVKRSAGMSAMSGLTSYEGLRAAMEPAFADPAVKAVCMDIDSGGGEVAGLFEFTSWLMEAKKAKPLYAIATDDGAYSAAYAIGCCADQLYLTKMGGVGSIGAVIAHMDFSEADKKDGVKVTYIYAGAKKVDGNSHQPLSKSAYDEMQARVDRIQLAFAELVAVNRGVSVEAILATEAGLFHGATAVPMLADKIGTLGDLIAAAHEAGLAWTEQAQLDRQAPLMVAADTKELVVGPDIGARVKDLTQMKRFREFVWTHAQPNNAFCSFTAQASVGEGRKITLLVVPYGELSEDLGGFRELYEPGCFKGGLGNDPHVLFNHDAGCVLGRPSAGTARFTEDARGVHVEVEAPETTWANDLLVSMRRGDISQASASFWILQHRMEYRGNTKVRVVERAMMREASVASFPAYPSTQAVVQPAAKVSMHEMQHLEDQLRVARLR